MQLKAGYERVQTSSWWGKSLRWLTCKRAHAGGVDWGLKTPFTFVWLSIYQYTAFNLSPFPRRTSLNYTPTFIYDCTTGSKRPLCRASFCLKITSWISSGPPRRERTAGACQISALPFGYDDSVNASLTKRLRPQFYKLAPDKLLSWRRCSRWRWGVFWTHGFAREALDLDWNELRWKHSERYYVSACWCNYHLNAWQHQRNLI